ncbi:MAG: acetate/propionate family kinase, partial [Actinomycetota bacterium]|nr:acetate/propionate family kinase [Actinomycetota bacterium]
MAALSDVLVVNAGSTSLKLALVDANERSRPVASLGETPPVGLVGHRVVHGGEEFLDPTPIDDAVERRLRELVELAPLHNAPALAAITQARGRLPDARHVAVFDTSFHRTIRPVAATYLLPARYREHGIRRFGFHGLSVQWSAERVRARRLVVCHLGGGSSVTAVQDGASADTSMGFTPLEGVPMPTRAGSFDPGALVYLLRHGVSVDDLDDALQHESGLRALAGTDDVGAIERDDAEGARLALEIYCYRIAQAVAAMAAALGGLDALVFTAGVGEHAAGLRSLV